MPLAVGTNWPQLLMQPMSFPCTVRPYAEADWLDQFDAVKESEARLVEWMPWCHPDYSPQEAQDWIRLTIEGHLTRTMFDFGVFDASGNYAGACGINQIRSSDRCANLGYWIRTSACGQGLGSAAALQVCRWAFANTNLERLEILVAVGNVPSRRVAEKLGAHYEGRLRSRIRLNSGATDAYLYSILRGDSIGSGALGK